MENTSKASTRGVDKGATVSLWAVAYLDLLGYSAVLSKMDMFPMPMQLPEEQVLRDAFVRAIHFRQRLVDGTNEFMDGALKAPAELASFPEDVQHRVATFRQVRVIQAPGPDHIILACSLAPDAEHNPIRGVYNLVTASAVTMLVQLAMGASDSDDTLPLRGGIDIAPGGLYGDPAFLFSPAVANAYALESEDAVYPRIIAGDRVRLFLEELMATGAASAEAKVVRATCERIRRMFFDDFDGWLTLDFLGEGMAQTLDRELAKPMVEKAWQFVVTKLDHFRARQQRRVAAKYAWLLNYMQPRLSIWGARA
jgi:hypothetical protein